MAGFHGPGVSQTLTEIDCQVRQTEVAEMASTNVKE